MLRLQQVMIEPHAHVNVTPGCMESNQYRYIRPIPVRLHTEFHSETTLPRW